MFLDIYNKLEYLRNNNLTCLVESKKEYKNYQTGETYYNSFTFDTYDIIVGKEEYHYYLVEKGKNNNNKYEPTTMSMKLSSIKQVISLNKTFIFSKEEKVVIKEKLSNGAEWMGGDLKEIIVEFSDYGTKLYEALYKDRPNYESINGNIYTFYTNGTALVNYLKPFGRHAKILSPNELNETLLSFYEKAYKNLKNC